MSDERSPETLPTVAQRPGKSPEGPAARPPSGNASAGTQVWNGDPTRPSEARALPAVPGYLVSREIARGGMGIVFAAHDPTFDREVAIKVMHPGQDAGRFVVESRVTARLPHPGVPPVHALGELADGRPFLVMKLITGRTLAAELMATGRADLPRLLSAFEQVCQTVGFAHSRGIVHRDLKPANVMVGAFGEVLVVDWGLAKHVDVNEDPVIVGPARHGTETRAGQVQGTPAYMAPEQARGESVDARADVFALGAVLCEILTERQPFAGVSSLEVVNRVAAGDLSESLTCLAGCGADAELVALTKRCLSADRNERPADAGVVAQAVADLRAAADERARRADLDRVRADGERATAEAEAREQRKRRRAQLALVGAVGLLFLVGGASIWRQERQASDRRAADLTRQVENERRAAYEQNLATGRALLSPIVARVHLKGDQLNAVDEFQRLIEENWPATLKGYNFRLIKPDSKDPEAQPASDDLTALHRIQNDPKKNEETRQAPEENAFYYYGAIRAQQSCVDCHRDPNKVGPKFADTNLQPDDLMGVVRVRLRSE